MSSNVRAKIPNIPGTRPATRNAQLLISSGIPSLDHFIGEGLPIGSILLIEEDAFGIYSKVVLKYFVAEGVVSEHGLHIASQDSKPSQIVSELPAVEEETSKVSSKDNKEDEMRIAWRYQNMKLVDSSPTHNTFGHYYDLTKKMPKELLEKADISLWNGDSEVCDNSTFHNRSYMDLLLSIDKAIVNGKYLVSQEVGKRNILRIAVQSLGSRMWMSDSESDTQQDLIKFLFMLRALLREAFAVAIITVPTLNFDDSSSGIVQRVEHLSDVVVGLESFSGSPRETNPVFKDYHGLLHIKKLPAFNTLSTGDSLYSDLAFKLRRKKFLVEILHLPPELGETTQREQDEAASLCCSGSKAGCNLDTY
ncbi:hypothetical protein QAD02_009500 [Eretmocerus hayati]|uniref:Uncharacterized protein n=1 Tax=Eretmocerus hayati TaxID=131215 RepID=A0ACC2N9S2_9HYME|nr:hypothetical protein QAD02_009500 [Eretmocerus hayati]